MIKTESKSLNQTIADGLSTLNVGDTVIVAWCIGLPHQETHTAKVEKTTNKQIIVEGRHFWKGSGKEAGAGIYEIYPNNESIIEWAVLMNKANSAQHSIHEMQPEALKDLLMVFEKHGHIQPQEDLNSKQPVPLIEVMERSGLLDD
jgi:hypothetical protein